MQPKNQKNLSDNYENVLKTKKEIFMTSMEGIVLLQWIKIVQMQYMGIIKTGLRRYRSLVFT